MKCSEVADFPTELDKIMAITQHAILLGTSVCLYLAPFSFSHLRPEHQQRCSNCICQNLMCENIIFHLFAIKA